MKQRQSCFDRVYDVAVVGAGYAGFSAACSLADQGLDVLLTCHDGATVWESGRAFAPVAGTSDAPFWQQWLADLAVRGGSADGFVDGACAEILASHWLLDRHAHLTPLYYVRPVAVEQANGLLTAVAVATKSGLRRICARRWIDATETGELLGLLDAALPAGREAVSRCLHLYFQENGFATVTDLKVGWDQVSLEPTAWPTERRLTVRNADADARARIPELVARLREELPASLNKAVMTHCSGPLDCGYEGPAPAVSLPGNVANAVAQYVDAPLHSLADRFALGLAASQSVTSLPSSHPMLSQPVPAVVFGKSRTADVVVAGGGTGGAIAAVAAAENGAKVLCLDLMPFVGGVGSGGGINGYCKGAPGGLFEQIDQRARELCNLFGAGRPAGGWHHETKKLAFAERFASSGVEFLGDTIVFDVETQGSRLVAVHASTPAGPVRIVAKAFVDGSGDADLCRRAGAPCQGGRPGDSVVLTFSQVAGQVVVKNDAVGMGSVNYDAGHVDPTDPEDFSRGRVHGVAQFLRDRYQPLARFYYLAPVIGLRQSVHIRSDRDVTVSDMVQHRRFPDSIGPTLAFLDTHAIDFEFDDDEVGFWLWVCRNFRGELVSDLPYGMLLPQGLDNVWVGCRAAGMTTAAAYSLRMERDIQRLGEAAGTAAALAVAAGCTSREVDMADLQSRLRATGSLSDTVPSAPTVADGLAALRAGEPSGALWQVYEARPEAEVVELLAADSSQTSWLAACLLAMWGDERAESRLLQAIAEREKGPEPTAAAVGAFGQRIVVPNWLTAVVLLRRCGTAQCLPALAALAAEPRLVLNVRTVLALTLERLLQRCPGLDRATARQMADQLVQTDPPDRVCKPSRSIDLLLKGEPQLKLGNDIGSDVREDHGWQLHVVVARIRRALGEPVAALVEPWLADERATIRRPFLPLAE